MGTGKQKELETGYQRSNFKRYGKSDGKPMHLDVHKELKEDNKPSASFLLRSKFEEGKINNNGESGNNSFSEFVYNVARSRGIENLLFS